MNLKIELLWSSAPSEYALLTLELWCGDRILRVDQENSLHDLNVTLLINYPEFVPRINFDQSLALINDIKPAFIKRFTNVNVITADVRKNAKRAIELKWSNESVADALLAMDILVDGTPVVRVDQADGLSELKVTFLLLPTGFDARINFDEFLTLINQIKPAFIKRFADTPRT